MRVGEPCGEIVAALGDHGEGRQSPPDIGGARGAAEVPGEGDDPRRHRRVGHGVQRVEQCGGGDLGGDAVADARREPRLGPARLGRFGDHQQRHRQGGHEITFQKSRIAVMLPRSDPLTFDLPPVRGP
ncbi:hypothetical protein MINTMi198_46030 [Mycobacterium intracellulare M.i.198]|nr:hypothetical protein MINTMi198_46030 [Mycobacterium intracellulare M.i.198]